MGCKKKAGKIHGNGPERITQPSASFTKTHVSIENKNFPGRGMIPLVRTQARSNYVRYWRTHSVDELC